MRFCKQHVQCSECSEKNCFLKKDLEFSLTMHLRYVPFMNQRMPYMNQRMNA